MDSITLDRSDLRLNWLVQGFLVQGQPAVLGGPVKSLKTSIAIDLAVSVGTGTPFLRHFPVPACQRVVVLTGESGAAVVRETARRVCAARHVPLERCDVGWQFYLPRLDHLADLCRLHAGLRDCGVRLVIIDPLYLCLFSGGGGQATNLYAVGPALLALADACLAAGATPVIVHHIGKSAASRAAGEPPQLADLAYAGIGEFARQWALVGRRTPYAPGTSNHDLILSVGGSAGHQGVWSLQVDEGMAGPDLGGRQWAVTVAPWRPSAPADDSRLAHDQPRPMYRGRELPDPFQ